MQESVKYLLIGGGVASVAASQAIRERDKEGSIVIVGQEDHMPYDRPPLSKGFLSNDEMTADDVSSKFDNYYSDNNITLKRGVAAKKVDRKHKTVELSNGETYAYEKLLLATGSTPKHLELPGEKTANVHLLRTIDDAEAIRKSMRTAKSAIVVGTGYIGMEVASQCVARGIPVTIITPDKYPWSKFASPKLGEFLQKYFEGKNAKFLLEEGVGGFKPGPIVVTRQEMQLEADFVVAGVGVTLNTDLAKAAGLDVIPAEGVSADEYLRTNDPDIYTAGDIACFKDDVMRKRWHVEHFLHAKWTGAAAGANMAGANEPYERVPYFFSDMLDLHMVLRGDPQAGTGSTVFGDMDAAELVELYHNDLDEITMGVAFSKDEPKLDPISDTLADLVKNRAKITDVSGSNFGF